MPELTAPAKSPLLRKTRIALGACSAVSGTAALIFEVVWTRQLSQVFSSTVYALSIMLAAFMAGLAVGSVLGGRRADSNSSAGVTDLIKVETGIALTGSLATLAIRLLPGVQYSLFSAIKPSPLGFFTLQMCLAFLVMLPATTLMGATFPLLTRAFVGEEDGVGTGIGSLYALNTVGGVVGSLAAGFVFIPTLGPTGAVAVAATLNTLAALLLRRRGGSPSITTPAVGAAGSAVLIAIALLMPQSAVPLSFGIIGRFESLDAYRSWARDMRIVWSEENEYSRVVVFEGGMPPALQLANGSLLEGANDSGDFTTTALLSLLPAAHVDDPETGLVVGLGTGLTSGSMLALPVQSVTTVEINPAMRDASRLFMGDDLESDDRWRLVETDARHYLARSEERFDIITSEPSWPLASAVSSLFTLEFFELVSEHLTEDGVFCQWLPQYLVPREDFMMMYKTFERVFPGAQVWIVEVDGQRSTDLFLVGTKDGQYPDPESVRDATRVKLAELGLGTADPKPFPSQDLLAEALSETADVPLNTDDRPLLEFHVPWSLVGVYSEAMR